MVGRCICQYFTCFLVNQPRVVPAHAHVFTHFLSEAILHFVTRVLLVEFTAIAFSGVVVAIVTCHDCKFILSTFSLTFVHVLCGSTTSFAFQQHLQLLLIDDDNNSGSLGKIKYDKRTGGLIMVKGHEDPVGRWCQLHSNLKGSWQGYLCPAVDGHTLQGVAREMIRSTGRN